MLGVQYDMTNGLNGKAIAASLT